jgi:DNA-binding PadR family transcriptional regulator
MMKRDHGLLGYALLGLLHANPSSGYALRKMFALTPLSTFSDSPGAIYPALRRLVQDGLIRGRMEKSAGLRRRQMFQLTPAGIAALKQWLALPPTRDEVMRRMDELLLRFAFMEHILGRDATVRFLTALERELTAYVSSLHAYFASARSQMPRSARLALESGVREFDTRLRWTRDALTAYDEQE